VNLEKTSVASVLRVNACAKRAIRTDLWIRKSFVNEYKVALEMIFLEFQKTAASEFSPFD